MDSVIDELGVYFRPGQAAGRVRQARGTLVRRGLTTLVFVVAVLVVWLIVPAFAPYVPWFVGVSVVTGVVGAAFDLVTWRRVIQDAARAGDGLALGLNRDGALVGQVWYPWAEVGAMRVTPGRLGASDRLEVVGRDAAAQWLPLSYMDAMPAWLDGAVRALSAGRIGVDLSRLDA